MNDNRECSDMYHENMSGVIPYETFESRPPRRKARYIRVKRRAAAFALVLSVGFSAAFGFGAGNALGSAAAGAQNSSPQAAPVSSGYTQLSASGTDMNVEQVAAATANSVVEITTEIVSTDPRMGQYVTEGAGSGVIISSDGYIVTNNHVIEGASKITVRTRSGDTYSGTLIGTDEKTDLAVVKVDATGLSPATIGSSDDLVVGQSVVAIGNPLGNLGGTVTDGIISALDREITIDDETMTLLQTNAAINPGNSGGGLFNMRGELVGIVNAKSSGTGIEGLGFAIPMSDAEPIITELISQGYVTGRIDLGMTLIDINSLQSAMMYRVNYAGLYIRSVTEGSAAQSAGFRAGDLITAIDGTDVSSESEFSAVLKTHQAGDTVKISIVRNGEAYTLPLTLAQYRTGASSGTAL